MKALTWRAMHNVRLDIAPDSEIQDNRDQSGKGGAEVISLEDENVYDKLMDMTDG